MSHCKPDLGVIENAEDNFITLKEKRERGKREREFPHFREKKKKRGKEDQGISQWQKVTK